jgi:hypothetical protein
MIIETLVTLAIQTAIPVPIQYINNVGILSPAPVFAARSSLRSSFSRSRSSFSSSRSSSFSRPSSSFSSGSSFSSPKYNYVPRPSTPTFSPMPIKAPSISVPKSPAPVSSPSVVRINKQNEPKPTFTSIPTGVKSQPSQPYSPRVVTRETYVTHYNDSGIMGNPWFWMYMVDNNRNSTPQPAPTQVVVKDSSGESVKIPENQMIVKRYSYNPFREFLVCSLGLGLGVLVGRRLA